MSRGSNRTFWRGLQFLQPSAPHGLLSERPFRETRFGAECRRTLIGGANEVLIDLGPRDELSDCRGPSSKRPRTWTQAAVQSEHIFDVAEGPPEIRAHEAA
jgi:hypothetical protein